MQNIQDYLTESYERITNQICRYVSWNYKLDRGTSEDIAAKAVIYVLTPFLEGKKDPPPTAEDFERLAWKFAKLRALDECARIRRSSVAASTDEMRPSQDGEDGLAENPALADAAVEIWRNKLAEEERLAKARLCMRLLPRIFRECRVTPRDQAVYRAAVVYQVPTEVVGKMFGINSNHIYQIVHKVGNRLTKRGRAIVEAEFAA